MKRAIPLLLSLGCLAGCSSLPGFDDPTITAAPYYAVYKLKGGTSLESGSGGSITPNPSNDLRDFGIRSSNDDVGGFVTIGDGFSGLDLHYLQLDIKTTAPGTLGAAWGMLDSGDMVRARAEMDEWRARYIAQVFQYETDDELVFRLGAGATIAHRSMDFQGTEISGARRQEIRIRDDGVAYASARAEVARGPLSLRGDYSYSEDWTFGGDWDGTLQDLELTLRFAFEDQDLQVFAGYRRSELPARSEENDLRYDVDFVLDGFFFGAQFSF